MNFSMILRSNFLKTKPLLNFLPQKNAHSEKNLLENPFYEKYADKIVTHQKVCSMDIKDSSISNKGIAEIQVNDMSIKKKEQPKVPFHFTDKKLSQIMNLELLEDKSSQEIEFIWKQYHQQKEGLYAVLPFDNYENMYSRFIEYPTFLFPLPRSEGYEFIMCQICGNSCHFTTLINFQAYKENAPECLKINYFLEFKDKGIVLMRGEFDKESLNVQEAQCLANQLQLYYSGKNSKKERLLKTFNKYPNSFKYIELISEFQDNLIA